MELGREPGRLLVVEDEPHLAEVISDNLEVEGYAVEVVHDGHVACDRILSDTPDLVLLDVMLPGLDGVSVCEKVRAAGNQVPVLFLTAKGEEDDRVRGLEAGGDDYLAKPFDLRELLLRVRAILRRTAWFETANQNNDQLTLGDCLVDFKSYQVQQGDRERALSAKEVMILRCLAERPGEVVTRDEILDRVWGYDAFPTTRTIDNFIVRLRRLLEPDPQNPRYIHTIRGKGYRLTP